MPLSVCAGAFARGFERLFRRDHEQQRLEVEQFFDLPLDKAADFLPLRDAEQIDLIDDENDLLAVVARQFEIEPLGFRERALGGDHEDHQIAAMQEGFRRLFVLLKDRSRAGGIDQRDARPRRYWGASIRRCRLRGCSACGSPFRRSGSGGSLRSSA